VFPLLSIPIKIIKIIYKKYRKIILFIIMEQFEYNNYYLYDCNLTRDIENNIGEIKIPDFTMEHIIMIDEKYKQYFVYVNEIANQKNKFIQQQINQMNNKFELNELYMEHVHNIEVLIIRMNEYNKISHHLMSKHKLTVEEKVHEYMFIRSKQIQMYFEDILPIIQNDKENLNSLIILLENMINF